MAASLTVEHDPDHQLLNLVRKGSATSEDMEKGLHQIVNHPAFPTINKIVMDLSDATVIVDSNETKEYARKTDEFIYKDREIRVAVIAPKDINFGMSHVYLMLSENSEKIRVVRNRDEAYEWLGIV